ncbi:MAG: threonine/serine dehydratase [Candidatus Lokiarchaeota archaeon]|nr:threonine/serine dehydratase [Candidatus Lokiarchaeota archaeon]
MDIFKSIKNAYTIISRVANVTPVMTSRTLDSITGAKRVIIKCENFQRTGSFKFRGAWNCISHIPIVERERGIIAHSSGNFAQAVALVATILQLKATIVMPNNATPSKIQATKGYGAEVVLCGNEPGDRAKKAEELIQKYNYRLIHPFDDNSVIVGAGTTAYELMNSIDLIDLLFVPIGGGGLISGCSIAAKGIDPRVKVIGVEPKNADDAFRSFQLGKRVPVENPNTIADGLRTSVGELTFPIIQENVDKIITVTEEQIIDAMRFYWERMKLIVEPSGAVSLAGLLSGNIDPSLIKNRRIGIIISGGNIDLSDFFATLKLKLA